MINQLTKSFTAFKGIENITLIESCLQKGNPTPTSSKQDI